MKKKIIYFYKHHDKFFLLPIFFSIASIFIIIALLAIFYGKLPDKIPLFYSLLWGERQLVQKQQFFLLPGVLLSITSANLFIAAQLHPLQYILKRMLTLNIILIDIIILLTVIRILVIFI